MRYMKGKAKVELKRLKALRTEAFGELAAYTANEPEKKNPFLEDQLMKAKQRVVNYCKRHNTHAKLAI